MYEIEFYEDKNQKSEVYEYIKDLQNKNSKESKQKLKKIILYIDLLSENGLRLTESYIKKINDEIWELRPLRDRILFASWHNSKFVLLTVFMKKNSKKHLKEKYKRPRKY